MLVFASATELALAATVIGGDGTDTIEIKNDATVADSDFTRVATVETLLLSGTVAQSVTLANLAQDAGIRTVTATAGNASTINIAGTTAGLAVSTNAGNDTVIAGSGADNISTGDGNDTIRFQSANFTSADTVAGGAGSDTIEITDFATVVDANFTNVTSVERLLLGNFVNTVTLGDLAALAGVATVVGGGTNDTLILTDDPDAAGDIRAIRFESTNGNDTFNIGGLTVTGTLALDGGGDKIIATNGANISGLNAGAVTTAETLELTGGITMTVEQHNFIAIDAGGGSETGDNIDTVTLSDAGVVTGQGDVETYNLADGIGNVFTQVTGNTSINGGSGNDRIITSGIDATRGALTIDLSEGGRDTVVINNAGQVVVPNLIETNGGGVPNQFEQFGGVTLNGFVASAATTPDVAGDQDLDFIGTYAGSLAGWNGSLGTSAVTILGFTAGDGVGSDVIETFWEGQDLTSGVFVENAVLGQTDLSGVFTGSVIELNANQAFQIPDPTNLAAVAALLSNNGQGDALLSLADGDYTIILYNGSGGVLDNDPADAFIFHITVRGGDGFDFNSNEGTFDYDGDSLELIARLVDVGANMLTGQNFA